MAKSLMDFKNMNVKKRVCVIKCNDSLGATVRFP